ncbi:hypothetical protein DFH09DRAFT_1185045, partial [Mycena vulgaris]
MSCGSEYAFFSLSPSFSSTEKDLDVARDTYHRVVCPRCLRLFSAPANRPPRPLALHPRPSYISSSVLLCRRRSSPSIRVHLHFVDQLNTYAIAHGAASLPPGVVAPLVSTPCLLRPLVHDNRPRSCACFPPASGIKLASAPLDRIPPRSARPLSLPRTPSSFAPCVPASANLQRWRRITALPRCHPSAQDGGGDEQKRGGLVDGLLA